MSLEVFLLQWSTCWLLRIVWQTLPGKPCHAIRYDDASKGVNHVRWLQELLATLDYMSFHSVVRQGINEDMKAVKDADLTWQKIVETVKRDQRYSAAVGDSELAAQVRARRVEALSQEIAKHESARAQNACLSNQSAHQARVVCAEDIVRRNCRGFGHNRVECRGRCAVAWCNAGLLVPHPKHAVHCPLEIKSQSEYRSDQWQDCERVGGDRRVNDSRRDPCRDHSDGSRDRRDRDRDDRCDGDRDRRREDSRDSRGPSRSQQDCTCSSYRRTRFNRANVLSEVTSASC